MMRLAVGFIAVSLLVLCPDCGAQSYNYLARTSVHNSNILEYRERRAISPVAKAGQLALKVLLKDARRTRTRLSHTRKFVKEGGLGTAMKEFHSIPNASDVSEFAHKNGKVLVRHVGDKQITLVTGGDRWDKGKPFIEVRDANGTIEKFVYQNKVRNMQ